MKNLLTTITLLCFSVAANADVFICEEKKSDVTRPDGGSNLDLGTYGLTKWIVNTDKGYGYEARNVVYVGRCEVNGKYWLCKNNDDVAERTFAINTEDLNFTLSSHYYGSSVTTGAGTCIKA
jgi:hypothetical protein